MGDVVVGTCSWADKSMVRAWYPRGVSSAEARLRYYADRFDAVEVDSTFYGLPRQSYVAAWADRTPPGFTFHVKAYGLMTGHEVDAHSLGDELRGYDHAVTTRGRVRDPEPRMVERAFELFRETLTPLADAGKLGGILMQFPPWATATDSAHEKRVRADIERAQALLEPWPLFIEFRHPSWVEGSHLKRTLKFLSDHGLTYVAVDEPRLSDHTTLPPVSAATSRWGYVRMHGRNADTWHLRTASASDRFDYLYTMDELREWEAPVRELAHETDRTWVMFNNCRQDYAPRNARDMAVLLGEIVAPRRGGVAAGEPAPRSDGPFAPTEPPLSQGQLDLGL